MKLYFVAVLAVLGCLAVSACSETAGPRMNEGRSVNAAGSASGQSATDQLNAIRAKAGRKPVERSPALDAAARAHVVDLTANGIYGHIGSNGSKPGERVTKAGYRWCTVAENLGEGTLYNSESKVITGWANSPSHYRNIIKPQISAFGMAQKGGIWVQVLAAKSC